MKIRFALVELIAILSLITISTILYTFVGWQKHYHFQTFAWDTSFFVQQLYFIKNLQPPFTSLYDMNGLGDHFHIVFLLTGGLGYFLWSDPRVIFLVQSLLVSLSLIPLYLLSKLILAATKLSKIKVAILSFLLCFIFIFSVPMQFVLTDEFHNDPLAILPLISLFYFLLSKKPLGFWVSFLFVMLTKETYGLFAVPLGIYIYLSTKNKRQALLVSIIGALVFYLLVYLVMPALSPTGRYFHYSDSNDPKVLVWMFLQNPLLVIERLIDSTDKRLTILISLASFSFLPLLKPIGLILPLFSLMIRFYDTSTTLLVTHTNHYSTPLMPFLAIASVFGLRNLLAFLESKKRLANQSFVLISLVLISVTIILDGALHGPLNSIFKTSFYEVHDWEKDAHALIKVIPEKAVIASQNSLLPHLSERDKFRLLPKIDGAEYIAVDLVDGPNKFAPLNFTETHQLINELILTKKYFVVWQYRKAMLLKKV